MTIKFDHIIVWAEDQAASATFLAEMLGLPGVGKYSHFDVVDVGGVSFDFAKNRGPFKRQHHAFLVSEAEFDEIFGRIQERELQYWADPQRKLPGEINHEDGGRGVYFTGPDDHNWEIITVPYSRESPSRTAIEQAAYYAALDGNA